MAIYHMSIKMVSRSYGKSAVAAAAYRAGELLEDEELGKVQDYTHKRGVVMSQILLPENAPDRLHDRETLWNEVQRVEKTSNAQLAREVEVALPVEMSREEQIECVTDFINECFVSRGMIADWALHDREVENPNPHVHILLTVRGFTEDGKWDKKKRSEYVRDENGDKVPEIDPETGKQKVRIREGKGVEKIWKRIYIPANDWSDRSKAEEWRRSWADHCNRYLSPDQQIDHRSFERQGIDRIPTIHEGVVARSIEKKGGISDRRKINQDITWSNYLMDSLKAKAKELAEYVKEKARDVYEKVKKLTGLLEGNRGCDHRYTRESGRSSGDSGIPGGRDRRVEEGKLESEELFESVNNTERQIRNSKQISDRADLFIGIASDEIDRLEAIVRVKEEQNARYRRILERRETAGFGGRSSTERKAGGSEIDIESFLAEQQALRSGETRYRGDQKSEARNSDSGTEHRELIDRGIGQSISKTRRSPGRCR